MIFCAFAKKDKYVSIKVCVCVLVVFKWMKLCRACMTHCGCLIFLIRLCAGGGDESHAFKIQFTSHIMSRRAESPRGIYANNELLLAAARFKIARSVPPPQLLAYIYLLYININVCS